MATRIEKTDLARDALYDKVNTMIDEVNTKIDNKDSLPSQTGNTGKFLTTDGTNASWGEVKQIEIKQDLTNPSPDTVPSTKAVSDESSRITTLMNTKVSNCITEIPQDIKLELNNGTLTLKAGSKVYIPAGFESDGVTRKFDIHIISSDKVIAYGSKFNDLVIITDINDNSFIASTSYTVSGDTQPTDISRRNIWYDTTTNKVKTNSPSTSNFETNKSLPITIVNCIDVNKFTISQIFNGFGYIGSIVFALPGVKGLIPNGRNADGSLKNIEVVQNSIKIMTMASYMAGRKHCPLELFFNNELGGMEINFNSWGTVATLKDLPRNKVYAAYYCLEDNFVHYFNDTGVESIHKSLFAATFAVGDDNKITSFTSKTVFHALDYNDKSTISGWSMPSSRYIDLTPAHGQNYIAPANGYFALQGYMTGATFGNTLGLYNQTKKMGMSIQTPESSGSRRDTFVPASKGDTVTVFCYLATVTEFRFIYAEGENS